MKSFAPPVKTTASRASSTVQRTNQPAKPFVDNRPQAIAQRNMQEAITNSRPVVQRRLPQFNRIQALVVGDPIAEKKLKQAILRDFNKMNAQEKAQVKAAFLASNPTCTWDRLLTLKYGTNPVLTNAEKNDLGLIIQAIKTVKRSQGIIDRDIDYPIPTIESGPPQPGSDERTNLDAIVNQAVTLIDQIVAGNHDVDVRHVFGDKATDLAAAKKVFEEAAAALRRLHTDDKIILEARGDTKAVNAGGLTGKHQMLLSPGALTLAQPGVIDPTEYEKIVTIIHECTHAIDKATTDKFYRDPTLNSPFLTATTAEKLTLAPHYEEVARRILVGTHNIIGVNLPDFTPRNAPQNANNQQAAAVIQTPLNQAQADVEAMFVNAWTVSINIRDQLRLWAKAQHNTPDFTDNRTKNQFQTHLNNLSRLLGLTIHRRAGQNNNPVQISDLDLSIAEDRAAHLATCVMKAKNFQTNLQDDRNWLGKAWDWSWGTSSHIDKIKENILNYMVTYNGETRKNLAKEVNVIKALSASYNAGRANYFTDKSGV